MQARNAFDATFLDDRFDLPRPAAAELVSEQGIENHDGQQIDDIDDLGRDVNDPQPRPVKLVDRDGPGGQI